MIRNLMFHESTPWIVFGLIVVISFVSNQ